jgi:hypothetical protein
MCIPVARCELFDAASVRAVSAVVADFGGSDFSLTTDEGEHRRLEHARHNAYPAGMATVSDRRAIRHRSPSPE